MDGNLAGGAPDGFDNDCLDPTGTPANNVKDYIAIPFAAVTDLAGPTVVHHSLFCLNSLDGKILECKRKYFCGNVITLNNFYYIQSLELVQWSFTSIPMK